MRTLGIDATRVVAIGFAALALFVGGNSLAAQEARDLAGLSIEELMDIEVTTVSRFAAPAGLAPAALHVITSEDVRRSGATTLPEVLRLAPGAQVARVDAGKWSVGIRGFADRLSRSMLVMIDGRSVYNPLFAGTYWEMQDVPLDDVERIEVIRGPGGTLWGANAVNGIINVVTRSARDSQGTLVHGSMGPGGAFHGAVRHGTTLGDSGFLRAYVRGLHEGSQFHTGEVEYDGWRMAQGGLRYDGDPAPGHALTVQGDVYVGRLREHVRETLGAPPYLDTYAAQVPLSGGNVLARWSRHLGDTDVDVQTYYDRATRDEYPVRENRQTFDVDVQLRHYLGIRHELTWGAGYRLTSGDFREAPAARLPSGTEQLPSVFVQDQISLLSDRLRVTIGAKVEHNDYSGFEVQPSGRVLWRVDARNTAWAAVTRAVRTPSRVERQYERTSVLDPTEPTRVHLHPNPDFRSERLLAYEMGYRAQVSHAVLLNLAAFYNVWNDLLTVELTEAFEPGLTTFPVQFRNGLDGNSYGFELSGEVRPAAWWRTSGHYALLRVGMTLDPDAVDLTQKARYEGGSPRHQARLQTSLQLSERWNLEWALRHVSELPDLDIPAYTTADVRLAWESGGGLAIYVVGRDLLAPRHAEWAGEKGGADVMIERTARIGLSWRP